MKLIMTLLVRDEEDIIRANIDYHLAQGVDFIIATDNGSIDGTAEIILEYEAAGLADLIREPDDTYDQHVWVTRMARAACRDFGADWVINSDADEFWWPARGNLKEILSPLDPETTKVVAPRYNFVMEDGRGDLPFYSRMTHCEVKSFNSLGSPLPPKMAHRGSAQVTVAQGNHDVHGLGGSRPAEGIVEILHFPVRSYDQLKTKIEKGGAAYSRNTTLPKTAGHTWRMLYRELQEAGNLEAYFATVHHDARKLKARLAAGEVVEDLRLVQFLAENEHGLGNRWS